ncbi:unnamed protein product [Gordionus sp. m RMFG-2023]|uniref:uncharacterized protein LOC135923904 isoform X2 n=1 Tax=Gordionus sp. m RMFG-2023 TaxID=3053472 RepID=UPI0030DE7497
MTFGVNLLIVSAILSLLVHLRNCAEILSINNVGSNDLIRLKLRKIRDGPLVCVLEAEEPVRCHDCPYAIYERNFQGCILGCHCVDQPPECKERGCPTCNDHRLIYTRNEMGCLVCTCSGANLQPPEDGPYSPIGPGIPDGNVPSYLGEDYYRLPNAPSEVHQPDKISISTADIDEGISPGNPDDYPPIEDPGLGYDNSQIVPPDEEETPDIRDGEDDTIDKEDNVQGLGGNKVAKLDITGRLADNTFGKRERKIAQNIGSIGKNLREYGRLNGKRRLTEKNRNSNFKKRRMSPRRIYKFKY